MKRISLVLVPLMIVFFTASAFSQPLRVGAVSSEPEEEIETFLPFSQYLSSHLESVSSSKVVITRSSSEMAGLLAEGKVDIYIDSPLSAYNAVQKAGAKFMLRRWKKGIAEYNSTIFVRKDSSIQALSDLQGKMIAFERPDSASGYLLPKLDLIRNNYELDEQQLNWTKTQDKINYTFSDDDENTFFWVQKGLVTAGAMSTSKFNEINSDNSEMMRALHISFNIPRHVVVYRKNLDPTLVTQIRQLLLEFEQSQAGREVLKQFEKTTKFDEIPSEFMNLWPSLLPLLESEEVTL